MGWLGLWGNNNWNRFKIIMTLLSLVKKDVKTIKMKLNRK